MTGALAELIQEIAVKHQISVGRDDPVLILHTINNRLLQDSVLAQQKMLADFKAEMEKIAVQWENDAKNKAERILNASLSASKEAANSVLQENVTAMRQAMQQETEMALTNIQTQLKEIKKVAWLNIGAAGITLVAGIIALLVIMR